MADILSKTFLDLDGLTLYDGKLKDHLSGTADSTGSDLVSVELTLNGDHASSGNYISELAVDTSALSTELGKKAEKNIGTITVKNGTTKVAYVTVDSLNDTIGDIMKPFAGKIWFLKFFMLLAKKQSGPKEKSKDGKKKAATKTQVDKGALDLMSGLTVLRMTSMMGMRNISFTKEELLELNAQLNKIKRK